MCPMGRSIKQGDKIYSGYKVFGHKLNFHRLLLLTVEMHTVTHMYQRDVEEFFGYRS